MDATPTEENSTARRAQLWLGLVLICFAGSLAIQIITVGFWWEISIPIVIVLSFILATRKRKRIILMLPWPLLASSFILFEKYVGQHYLLVDLCSFIIAIATVKALILRKSKPRAAREVFRLGIRDMVCAWLVFWVFASIADFRLLRRSVVLEGAREVPSVAKLNIGLALSGGGYRAALFHAGVLSILEHENLYVTRVSAVSGGAIIGSFYALGGSPEQFLTLVQQKRFNLRRQMFDLPDALKLVGSLHIPGTPYRVLPFGEFTRTDAHARMLDRVFVGYRWLGDKHRADHVQLMICVTDILKQEMIGVTAEGLVIEPIVPAVDRLHVVNPSHPEKRTRHGASYASFHEESQSTEADWPSSIAQLVAASAAFPGALRAVPVLDSAGAKRGSPIWRWKYDEDLPNNMNLVRRLLGDGGIGDNTGLALLKDAHELSTVANRKRIKTECDPYAEIKESDSPGCWELTDWESSLFIASDGSAVTPIPSYSLGTNALKEATSAIDVATLGNSSTPSDALANNSRAPKTVLITPRAILSMPYSQDRIGDPNLVDFPVERDPPNKCTSLDVATGLESYFPPGYCETRGISMTSLNEAALRFIIANMSSDRRSQAEQYLRDLESHGAYDGGKWHVSGWPEGSAQHRLYLFVKEELWRCMAAFLQTPTLDDHPPAESSERVFRLGQYLTLINLPIIRNEVEGLSKAKSALP